MLRKAVLPRQRLHVSLWVCYTNNIYLSASRGLWKLPELSVSVLPFSYPNRVLPAKFSYQASYISLVQVGTGLLIRGQISGTMDSLAGMRWGWIGTEWKRERAKGGMNAHTRHGHIGRLCQGRSASRVSSFKTLLESSIAPELSDWLEQLRFSIQVCFPRRLQLFLSSCEVIWWKINPTFIKQHIYFFLRH